MLDKDTACSCILAHKVGFLGSGRVDVYKNKIKFI